MSKKKKPFETRATKNVDSADREKRTKPADPNPSGFFRDRGVRETIESIVVAVMLALMFRAYEAEAFVIPTGSMAPTLQGRHLDTVCDKCGYQYMTGASGENPDRNDGHVYETICPICHYEQPHQRKLSGFKSNEDSFNGDRILVSKFAYDFADPERWDVIVFKYPGNAKQNYIKRLIGLPGETLKIANGDIYLKSNGEGYEIARKPADKLRVMLQLVDDTEFIADELVAAGWPSRWQQWDVADESTRIWKVSDSHANFSADGSGQSDASWLSYMHIAPRPEDWLSLRPDSLPDRIDDFRGELITDYYAYNDALPQRKPGVPRSNAKINEAMGTNWVGDLAIEAELKIISDTGSVGFKLVEGGVRFTCWIDVATGQAKVSSSDDSIRFGGSDSSVATAETRLDGPGNYDVRFANADNQLYLWVNNRIVEFDKPLTYDRSEFEPPIFSEQDPGDAQPVAIGTRGVSLEVDRLKVLRDIYYIPDPGRSPVADVDLRIIAENPESWADETVIAMLRSNAIRSGTEYVLEADQFMPMGDNSPQSLDARAWPDSGGAHYVDRDMLTGKALFVYWPHAWRPFWPNFKRMGFIK